MALKSTIHHDINIFGDLELSTLPRGQLI